jgi:hypothetical protein
MAVARRYREEIATKKQGYLVVADQTGHLARRSDDADQRDPTQLAVDPHSAPGHEG